MDESESAPFHARGQRDAAGTSTNTDRRFRPVSQSTPVSEERESASALLAGGGAGVCQAFSMSWPAMPPASKGP